MKIQVLGTGCHNCLELEILLAKAIEQTGRKDIEVERVDDERAILHYIPLEEIPGLVVDGKLVYQREVPTLEMLVEWLKA